MLMIAAFHALCFEVSYRLALRRGYNSPAFGFLAYSLFIAFLFLTAWLKEFHIDSEALQSGYDSLLRIFQMAVSFFSIHLLFWGPVGLFDPREKRGGQGSKHLGRIRRFSRREIVCVVLLLINLGNIDAFFSLGLAYLVVDYGIRLLPKRPVRDRAKRSPMPYRAAAFVFLAIFVATTALMILGLINAFLISFAWVCLRATITCWCLSQQKHLPEASELLARDQRPPVLLLRSFSVDSCLKQPWYNPNFADERNREKPWYKWTQPFPEIVGQSFDEFLSPVLSELGPFIALGNPLDYLPSRGSSKTYARDHVWEQVVLEYLSKARFIFLVEGETHHLKWELEQIRRHCDPTRCFLLTMPDSFPRLGFLVWARFTELLKQAGFDPPDYPGRGAVIGFDADFRPTTLLMNAMGRRDYRRFVDRLKSRD
jgi:hypothetical protein